MSGLQANKGDYGAGRRRQPVLVEIVSKTYSMKESLNDHGTKKDRRAVGVKVLPESRNTAAAHHGANQAHGGCSKRLKKKPPVISWWAGEVRLKI
jgi:hypothetical protein